MNTEDELRAEVARLSGLINSPHIDDFFESVKLEAAHQRERFGEREDKSPMDWYWLLGYLAGKSMQAFVAGDREKGLHHIISSAAVLLNWHRTKTQ